MVDGDLYKRSAACYFYGKSLSAYGRKAEALEVYKKVSADAGGSKYAEFCSDLLKTNTPQALTPQTTAPVQ